jgi:IS30 family transposase
MNLSKIADCLSRSKSTISGEIRRGTFDSYYSPINSENRFIARLSRNKILFLNNIFREFVFDKLIRQRRSSTAIAGRIKTFSEPGLKVLHETIYKFIYSDEGLSLNLLS